MSGRVPTNGARSGATDWALRDLVASSLEKHARHVALQCDGEQLTYEQLDRASLQAAVDLRAAGVLPGDRVALLVANGLEYPVYDFGILRAGAVKVPLNDMLAAPDVAYALEHSGARLIVVSDGLAALAEAAREQLAAPPALHRVRPAADLVAAEGPADAVRDTAVAPDDPVAIYYTGGTTGKPKAIMHSQRNFALNMLATMMEAEIGRDDRLLLTTPLPHAAGTFALAGLIRGARVVIERRFDAAEALRAIAEHRITWTFMVPTMLYRLLDAPALTQTDHSSLRTVLYGAAPMRPDRLAQAVDLFGPVFVQLYGQTECPNFVTTLSKRDHVADPKLLASCGRPVLMADVTVRDESGRVLAPGETGEVCVRAPYTMNGYLGDPEATAGRFFEDDWLRTGDLGEFDADGFLYLKDRRNDMVISGGMNVYSSMVEKVVAECPGVGQAAVIGIPDPDWGEAVHAVVTAATPGLSEAEVLAFCRERLAGYMRPKSVEIVDELPLTPYGKMDKKQLRARHWEGAGRQIG